MKWNGKFVVVARVKGANRKSVFAVAESPNGIVNFRFWDKPITMPEEIIPATNIYDMRLTQHEDGWIVCRVARSYPCAYLMKFIGAHSSPSGLSVVGTPCIFFSIHDMLCASTRMVCIPSSSCAASPGFCP